MSKSTTADTFIHRYIPATRPDEERTLLLLHGTGGNEDDLIPLGETILPGAAILSPRGRISENGMPRFFRRFAEGVFDLDNLREETQALADFVKSSAERYGFDPAKVIAVGFSNGANIGSTLLFLRPEAVNEAVLIRTMVTLEDVQPSGLEGKRVFISSGRFDPIVPVENVAKLASLLEDGGADVTHHWVETGHNLTRGEIDAITDWLA